MIRLHTNIQLSQAWLKGSGGSIISIRKAGQILAPNMLPRIATNMRYVTLEAFFRIRAFNYVVRMVYPRAKAGQVRLIGTADTDFCRLQVEVIHGLVQYLVNTNEYNFGDIAVLTPYNGQLAALNERLSTTCSIWLSQKDKDSLEELSALPRRDLDFIEKEKPESKSTFEMSSMLRIASIDNFQGEEAKIVILSTVRSNADDKVGFLRTPNRINVACSRAKHGFYIIGNASLMRNVGMWQSIIDLLARKGKIGSNFQACCSRHPQTKYEIQLPKQFEEIPACTHACYSILECGHMCKEKCHPRSLHARTICSDPCRKILECGHKCQNSCYEPCGQCSHDLSTVVLSCGHAHTLTCSDSRLDGEPTCNAKLEAMIMPCGHRVDRFCHQKDEPPECKKECPAILSCGHRCSG